MKILTVEKCIDFLENSPERFIGLLNSDYYFFKERLITIKIGNLIIAQAPLAVSHLAQWGETQRIVDIKNGEFRNFINFHDIDAFSNPIMISVPSDIFSFKPLD